MAYYCMVPACNHKMPDNYMLCDHHNKQAHEAIKRGIKHV